MESANLGPIRCEFHCHTRYSHDGFNSMADVVREAERLAIRVVAITDHDTIGVTDEEISHAWRHGVQLIRGCEMTAQSGAHIIGLFVRTWCTGKSSRTIVDSVLEQGGVIFIPHPLKADTGIVSCEGLESPSTDYAMSRATFIELFNGDYYNAADDSAVRRLADRYHLRLVAGSDAHKPWQIGRYLNVLECAGPAVTPTTLREASVALWSPCERPSPRATAKGPVSRVRHSGVYQATLRLLPARWKRAAKEVLFQIQLRRYRWRPHTPAYERIKE